MSNAYWGYWLVLLGVFVVVILLLVQNLTTGSTQTYSMVNEIAEASLIDAVDFAYYRTYGEVKINKEKFMEVFIRRMAEVGNNSTTYEIKFMEIYEAPPSINVQVSSSSNTFNIVGNQATYDISHRVNAILETGNSGS